MGWLARQSPDKAYHSAEHLAWLRGRGLVARIARSGIESGERLGRHRWKIERSISWLFGYAGSPSDMNERAATFSPSSTSPQP